MAKENLCMLLGELVKVNINEKGTVAKLVLKTIRRNDKYDSPTVRVLNTALFPKIETFNVGDYVLAKGIVATKEGIKRASCPKCGKDILIKSSVTEMLAIDIMKISSPEPLVSFKEVSNIVRILGALCKKPEYTTTSAPKQVALCKYQIAVNRKLNVAQEADTFTDYPWVNSFARQAEQDAIRLDVGSQIYIDGGLQTRSIKRNITCEDCGEKFKASDVITEIVPYSVEYLNHCKFDDNNE